MIQSGVHGNQRVIVDEPDLSVITKHKWYLSRSLRSKTLYAATKINNKQILMHRLLTEAKANEVIDHKDGDGLNNSRQNLRKCTQTQNCWNNVKPNKHGFKGVYFKKSHNVFVVRITVNKKTKIVSRHKSLVDAAKSYNEAAKKYFGEFAKLNTI